MPAFQLGLAAISTLDNGVLGSGSTREMTGDSASMLSLQYNHPEDILADTHTHSHKMVLN